MVLIPDAMYTGILVEIHYLFDRALAGIGGGLVTWPLDKHILLSILLCAILVYKFVDRKMLGSEVQIMNSAQSIANPNLVLLSTFFLNCALPEV